jgi:hypothetical protein
MSQLVKVQPVSLDKLSETVDRAGLRKVGLSDGGTKQQAYDSVDLQDWQR